MSNKFNLYKDSIADAKLLKETALLNAKKELEESFAPHLKQMLSQKIQEMEDEDQIAEMEELEYNFPEDLEEDVTENADEVLEELFESILGESDSEDLMLETDDEEDDSSETEDADEDGEEEEIDLDNLDEETLTKFIEDVIQDMVKDGEIEPVEGEEEIDLDMDLEVDADDADTEVEEEEDLNESGNIAELEAQLDEALRVNQNILKENRDLNLLNSKLIYSLRLFKKSNLTESQKSKILDSFNSVKNLKESKLTYDILKENLEKVVLRKPKYNVQGFASKSIQAINENHQSDQKIIQENAVFARMKELAGL